MTISSLLRRPSASAPLVMSFAAIATIAWYLAAHGVVRQADEGAQARVWQLLMAGQVPIVAYFALTWVPRAPRPAMVVLGMQVAAAVLAAMPLWMLGGL